MLIVVSPAKRLDETPARSGGGTTPRFLDAAGELAATARALDAPALEKLMKISPKLAALNVDRFAAIGTGAGEKQAIEMFSGDTYTGLEAASLDADEMDYAQRHLRILSGLYGLLRPRDVIEPHRLEMGTRMANPRGRNLYEFWGDRIACQINADAAEAGTEVVVNCASVEYFTATDREELGLRVVTPVFMEDHPDGPRINSFFAKRARGAMARYIIQNRLRDPDALKDFDSGGYIYRPEMSDGNKLVFVHSA